MNTTETKIPVAQKVAKASWEIVILTWLLNILPSAFYNGRPPATWLMIVGYLSFALILSGLIAGIAALFGIKQHGTKEILLPALTGLFLNGGLILIWFLNQ